MSGWFGGGGGGTGNRSWQSSLDSLKNQVSSSLREVVDAVAVDPSTLNPDDTEPNSQEEVHLVQASPDIIQETTGDINDQLEVAISEVTRLKSIIDAQAQHIQTITSTNQLLSAEKENAEKQKEIQGSQFRELLMDKEEEINQLLETSKLRSISNDDTESIPKENIVALDRVKDLEDKIKELEHRMKEEEASHANQLNQLHIDDDDKYETLNGEVNNLKNENLRLIEELQTIKKSSSIHSDLSLAASENIQESPDNSITDSDEILRLKEEKSHQTERISELEKEAQTNESILAQKDENILHLEKQLNEQEAEFLNYKNICDDLHLNIKDLNVQHSDISEKLNKVTKECDTAKSKLASQSTVLGRIQRENDSYDKNCEELKISLQESEKALQNTIERLNQAVCENTNLKSDNFTKDKEIREASESYEELVETKGKEREELASEIQKQKIAIEKQLNDIESLKQDSQGQILCYEEKLSNINFELEDLKKQNLQNSEEEKPSNDNQVGNEKLEQTKLELESANKIIDNLVDEINFLSMSLSVKVSLLIIQSLSYYGYPYAFMPMLLVGMA